MITIVSWNVLAQAYLTPSYPKKMDWEIRSRKLLRHLLRLDADMVCLQEVDGRTYTFLKQHLRDVYHFSTRIPLCWSECTTRTYNLVLSRVKPICTHRFLVNPSTQNEQGIFRTRIRDKDVFVVNLHLHDSSKRTRQRELRRILDVVTCLLPDDTPVILAGDFNTVLRENPMSTRLKACGFTSCLPLDDEEIFSYELGESRMWIDYVFVKNMRPRKGRVGTSNTSLLQTYGSDHAPVQVTVDM